ncbi:MAG: nitric oxide reductase activation protein NorD, partial [Vicingaceae bacterium]
MEIDQVIFKKLHKFYQKVTTKVDPEVEARTVFLEPLKPRLTILSRALTGHQNEIITSEREGGWSGLKFYLPASSGIFNDVNENINYYIFRVLYLSVQQQLMLNWSTDEEQKVLISQKEAEGYSEKVLHKLFEEYPTTKQIYEELIKSLERYYENLKQPCDYSWMYGRAMRKNPHEFNIKTTAPEAQKKKDENPEITTELDANPSDEVTTVGINKKQIEDNVAQNQFEKVDTLSEFNGTFKEMDGEDSLSDDEDAIRELNLKHTVRADDISHSVYKAEFVNTKSNILVESESEKGKFLCYDEWDYKKRAYKHDFCKVYPKFVTAKSNNYAHKTLLENSKTKRELFKMFAQVHNEYEKVNRVVSGEQIDFDAVTDAFAEINAQRTPTDKIYTTKRKRKKDLSVLILVDTSLSSDGYTNNEHVLSVEQKAVLLFGEVLSHYNISFEVDTFSSRTRNNCSYKHVKTFNENWNVVRDRIGAVEPEGYTRIGTALRHAGAIIEKEPTQRKWIILLSDGKPNDYDTYEGKYGIEDVKQVLRELDAKHINTFSLAI